MEFLESLDPLLKTFWFIAIPTSIIFIIQSIMTFTGMDSSEGIQADFDSNLDSGDAPFQLFSFRNLINFLLGFSWTGIAFFETISNKVFLFIAAISVGSLFVLLFFLIIKQLMRLAEDNTFNINKSVNKTAEVYINIPGEKKGKGKVQISVDGSVHEIDAVTEGEKISSGTIVKIVRVENNNLLVVEKI